jgi:hypothetical protein
VEVHSSVALVLSWSLVLLPNCRFVLVQDFALLPCRAFPFFPFPVLSTFAFATYSLCGFTCAISPVFLCQQSVA